MYKRQLSRLGFLVVFVLFVFPILPVAAGFFRSLMPLVAIDLFVRAIPLYISWRADCIFLDAGELSPQMVPLYTTLTAVLLWPLLALALRPELLSGPFWRRVIGGYTGVAVMFTCVASVWVFTHTGIFF